MCHSELIELIFESDSIREELRISDRVMIRQAQAETTERTIDSRVQIHRLQKYLRREKLRAAREISLALKCPTMQN